MLKGHTKIELFDAKSGMLLHKEEKHNLVTNYAYNVLNGLGNQMRRSQLTGGVSISDLVGLYTPIYTKLLGGMAAYSQAITESVNSILLPSGQSSVATASGEYSGSDSWRGTFNSNESGLVYDGVTPIGYRYVWDFGTDKGNGTISTICLTSANAGVKPMSIAESSFAFVNNTMFENELLTIPSVLPSESYQDTINVLAVKGNDIYYTNGTKVYKRSIINPSVGLLNAYTPFSAITEVCTPGFSMSKTFVMPDGVTIGSVAYSSTEFTINKLSTNDWTTSSVTIPYSGASSYSAYYPYFDGTRLFLFGRGSTTTLAVFNLLGERIHNQSYSVTYEKWTDFGGCPTYVDGYVILHFTCAQSTAGRCICVNASTLDVKYRLSGLDRYISSWSNGVWYRQIACPNISKPYVLFQRYKTSSTTPSESTITRDIVCYTFGDPMVTIQNLTEPVTKTAEKTMKITYTIQETQ